MSSVKFGFLLDENNKRGGAVGHTIIQPDIRTERLLLSPLTQSDDSDVFKMRTTAQMIAYTDSKLDESIEETRSYIEKMNKGIEEGKWFIWAIRESVSDRFMGSLSLWNFNENRTTAELGYGLMPEYQGQGYMKEALEAVIDFAFLDLGLETLEAYTEKENEASIALLKKLDFLYTETIEEKGYFSNKVFHMAIYKLYNVKSRLDMCRPY